MSGIQRLRIHNALAAIEHESEMVAIVLNIHRRKRFIDKNCTAIRVVYWLNFCNCLHVFTCDIKNTDNGPKMKIGVHAINAGQRLIRSGLGGVAAI